MKGRRDNRLRKFACVTYLPERNFLACLRKHQDEIIRYAYVIHDKDFKEPNVPEEVHIQFVLYTYNGHSYSAIRRWFKDDSGQNTLCQTIGNDIEAFEYLRHLNEKDPLKYHYPPEACITYNFNLEEIENDDNGFAPLQMLLNGEKKSLIAKRFGRDFIYHYKAYKELAEDILFEEGNQASANNKQTDLAFEIMQEELLF